MNGLKAKKDINPLLKMTLEMGPLVIFFVMNSMKGIFYATAALMIATLVSLGASRLQVFCKLVVPFCMPWIISVLRVNIGLALTGAVVGEFIASQHGLGREILYAGQTYDIALVWVAVLVLSVLAILMYLAVSWLEFALRKMVWQ